MRHDDGGYVLSVRPGRQCEVAGDHGSVGGRKGYRLHLGQSAPLGHLTHGQQRAQLVGIAVEAIQHARIDIRPRNNQQLTLVLARADEIHHGLAGKCIAQRNSQIAQSGVEIFDQAFLGRETGTDHALATAYRYQIVDIGTLGGKHQRLRQAAIKRNRIEVGKTPVAVIETIHHITGCIDSMRFKSINGLAVDLRPRKRLPAL